MSRNSRRGNRKGKPVIITAEQFNELIEKIIAGPPGSITHIAPDDNGDMRIIPDPDLITQVVQ